MAMFQCLSVVVGDHSLWFFKKISLKSIGPF